MNYFRNMTLTRKAALVCLSVCLIPLIIGFLTIFRIYSVSLNQSTMEFAAAFSGQITANLNHMIRDYEGLSLSVLVDNELFLYSEKPDRTVTEMVDNYEQYRKVLFRIVTLQPKVDTASILMREGDFVQTGSRGLKIDPEVLKQKPWVQGLENSPGNFYIIPAHKANYWKSRSDELTITFVRKILSSGVRYLGAVMIDLDPASIIVRNKEYEVAKQKYHIEIRIADADGNVVYDSYLMEHPELWQDGQQQVQEFGSDYTVLAQKSDKLGLTVYTAFPKAALIQEQKRVGLLSVLAVVLCGGIVIGVIIPFCRSVTGRLLELSYGMRQMKNGEYITIADYGNNDEIGMLVKNYNHMIREMQQLIDKVYKSELVKKNSEVVALQSQINPHMLFNTLEAIRMKALFNGDKDVSKMIFLLAKMFRTALDSQRDSHRIRDELKYAEEFLSLQNLRSNDRFCFTYDVDEELMDMNCIPILFQPLIENCIEHGQRCGEEKLAIWITGRAEGDVAVFHVYDDGRGMDPESLDAARARLEKARNFTGNLFSNKDMSSRNIGLTNILLRLRLEDEHCGDLEVVRSGPEGTCIRLSMSIKKQAGEEQ